MCVAIEVTYDISQTSKNSFFFNGTQLAFYKIKYLFNLMGVFTLVPAIILMSIELFKNLF